MSIVNPVLSVVDVVVRQSEGNLQYKNHQTHNFLLSSSTSHDPNGNYLGWVGWLVGGWLKRRGGGGDGDDGGLHPLRWELYKGLHNCS